MVESLPEPEPEKLEEVSVAEVVPVEEPPIVKKEVDRQPKSRPGSVGTPGLNVYYKDGQVNDSMMVANYARRVCL